MSFNENTRVQVPAALHLCRLGYVYKIRAELTCDPTTNILTDVFKESVGKLNPDRPPADIVAVLENLIRVAHNEDLGREFYQKITAKDGLKIIDFDNPDNNSWICTTELPCADLETYDEFRPDVTCFVNGLPLAFVEVKIPNNHEGILAERERMNHRLSVPQFRSFLNVTQLMIFSNNQEYNKDSRVPIQGAFYSCITDGRMFFNVFREADSDILKSSGYTSDIDDALEFKVLKHRNCVVIKDTPEYETNKQPTTPTNRILTSMLSMRRFLFLLRYGFAYVDQKIELEDGSTSTKLQKHVMRYQQLFATLAIRDRIGQGVPSGVIWHTQGSGKTALAFHNVKALTDYFAKKETPVKFYFIVDRLDLMEQATDEFVARGLIVRNAQNREELMKDIGNNTIVENAEGRPEIMVVNIQRFAEDHAKVKLENQYSTKIQRVFFIDEAHRGYNPKGCFLANLFEADPASIKIALTGTPLLTSERESWKVFGKYIDTYYYDKSIADGYTLKLMRDDIETDYKEKIVRIIDNISASIKIKKSDFDHNTVIENESYLSALLEYIIRDIKLFRIQQADKHVAGMIVCETNPQARALYRLFSEHFAAENLKPGEKPMKAVLILHDEGGKMERKGSIKEFKKKETIDFLIVNNMLLTGFDAPRLKKLYLCRKLDGYQLLQALTRVNRPYKNFEYGYIVDFANIKENFEATNNLYLKELNRTSEGELPTDETQAGDALLVTPSEVEAKLRSVKTILFSFNTDNLEEFRQQLDAMTDKDSLYNLRHTLEDAKAMVNQVRSFGDDQLKAKVKEMAPDVLPRLISEVTHRIDRVNLLESTDRSADVSAIVNQILEEISFSFRSRGTEELRIVYNDIVERCEKVRHQFEINIDKQEGAYVALSDEFREFFRKRGMSNQSVAEVKTSIGYIDKVMDRILKINAANRNLSSKYRDDEKFVRIHKRVVEANAKRSIPPEKPIISKAEYEIAENLNKVKDMVDETIYYNTNVLDNKPYFDQGVLKSVSEQLLTMRIHASIEDRMFIRDCIAREYLDQYQRVAG